MSAGREGSGWIGDKVFLVIVGEDLGGSCVESAGSGAALNGALGEVLLPASCRIGAPEAGLNSFWLSVVPFSTAGSVAVIGASLVWFVTVAGSDGVGSAFGLGLSVI